MDINGHSVEWAEGSRWDSERYSHGLWVDSRELRVDGKRCLISIAQPGPGHFDVMVSYMTKDKSGEHIEDPTVHFLWNKALGAAVKLAIKVIAEGVKPIEGGVLSMDGMLYAKLYRTTKQSSNYRSNHYKVQRAA